MRRSASARVMLSSTCDADTRALELGASSERVSLRLVPGARRRAHGRTPSSETPPILFRSRRRRRDPGTTARHRVAAAAARAGARRDAASRHPGRGAATDAARISLDATSRVPRPIDPLGRLEKAHAPDPNNSACLLVLVSYELPVSEKTKREITRKADFQCNTRLHRIERLRIRRRCCFRFARRGGSSRHVSHRCSNSGYRHAPARSSLERRRKTPHRIKNHLFPANSAPNTPAATALSPLRRRRRRGT